MLTPEMVTADLAHLIRRYGLRSVWTLAVRVIYKFIQEDNVSEEEREYIRVQALEQLRKNIRLALAELAVH